MFRTYGLRLRLKPRGFLLGLRKENGLFIKYEEKFKFPLFWNDTMFFVKQLLGSRRSLLTPSSAVNNDCLDPENDAASTSETLVTISLFRVYATQLKVEVK